MEHSKTYQYRKVMKPMLERKRRARINKCLDELKDIMVECLTQEGEHIVRLEKADILELTVDYLKKQRKQREHHIEAMSAESFRNGYINAANEVSRALASIPGVNITLGTSLMTHLGHRLNQLQSPATLITTAQKKSPNLMHPLKIELETVHSFGVNAIEGTVTSQISPTSSGYHSDLPSPVASESSYCQGNTNNINNNFENIKSVWRPW